MFTLLIAYTTIVLSVFNIKDKKTITYIFSLIALLAISSYKTIGIFYLSLIVALFFVNTHFFDNFLKIKNTTTFSMFFAFFLILIAQIIALFFKVNTFGNYNNLSFSILELIKFIADFIIIVVISKIFLKKTRQ